MGVEVKKVNWILDADMAKFFDTIEHDWLMKFVEHRVADARVVRLIKKWLRAGMLEDGQVWQSELGTVQGGSISPLLANIYLHDVLDLWARSWRQRHAKGDMRASSAVAGQARDAKRRRKQSATAAWVKRSSGKQRAWPRSTRPCVRPGSGLSGACRSPGRRLAISSSRAGAGRAAR